jgi:hypothetical protein
MIDMRKGIPHHAFGWCDKTLFTSLPPEQQEDTLSALRELIARMQHAVKEIGTSGSKESIPVSATGQAHQTVELSSLHSLVKLLTALEFIE